MKKIGQALKVISSGKLLVGGILAVAVLAFGTNSVAYAAPSYFNIDQAAG